MRLPALAALMPLCGACGPEILPPDFGGDPLWAPLEQPGDDLGEPSDAVPSGERQGPGPILLTDVTAAAGLETIGAGGNTHGVGLAFTDLTGDDLPDIVVISGLSNVSGLWTQPRFLVNLGDGTFANRSDESGLLDLLLGRDGYSVAAGDVDHDGDVDLYVGAQPTDVLLLNDGTGRFIDATRSSNAGGPPSDPSLVGNGKSKVVSLGDIDNDGWLDIVTASSTLPFPGLYVLHNRGNGTFDDVTDDAGAAIDPTGNPCAVMFNDFDTDADRDLWIWNDRGGKVLLANDGTGHFTDITTAAGLDAVQIVNPMGIDAADIDRDGDLDVYVSNIGSNPLLRNNGDGTFVDITNRAGTGGQYGWGLAFEDFNLDGWPDIFVAQEDDRPNLVFENAGTSPPTFRRIDVPHRPVLDEVAAHNVAAAFADYDQDGRVDVLTARTDGGRLTLYRNETDVGSAGWLRIRIDAPAGVEARGIGARVAVRTGDPDDGLLQFRDVTGGSSRASQNDLSARFGLGQFRGATWVGVLWPTGEQTLVRNVGAGQTLAVRP